MPVGTSLARGKACAALPTRCAADAGSIGHGRRAWLLLFCVTLLFALPQCSPLRADDLPASFPHIRRVYVPADKPFPRSANDLLPIKLSEFEQLLQARHAPREQPRSASIERAEYTATFDGNALRGGRFELDVRRIGAEPEALPLRPLNLAISQFAWSNGPAIWGTAPDGQSYLVMNRPSGKAVGEWSLPGRRLARSVDFDMRVAPAAVTQVVLRVPEGHVVRASGGDLLSPQPATEPGWFLWRVDLGSQTSLKLTVTRQLGSEAARPLVLARNDMTYIVRQEAVRFQAEYNIEVLGAGLQELSFIVDPAIQLISIHYGTSQSLSWRQEDTPQGRRVMVRLPELLLGQGVPLRVQGVAQVKPEPAWTLPSPILADSVLMEGQLTLRVEPPLQLDDLKLEGYRQVGLTTSTLDGETVILRQLKPQARASIVLGSPKFEASCRVLTHVQTEGEQWNLVSQLDWAVRVGSAFSSECLVPDEWEVTDVRGEGPARSSELAGWEIVPRKNGRRALVMYYTDSLSTDRPKRVRVVARRAAVPVNQAAAVPVFLPGETEDLDLLVAISSEPAVHAVLQPGSTFSPCTEQDVPQDWLELDFWRERIIRSKSKTLLLRLNGTAAAGKFSLQPAGDGRDDQPLADNAAHGAAAAKADVPASAPTSLESAPSPHPQPLLVAILDLTVVPTLQQAVEDFYAADVHLSGFGGKHDFRWELPEDAVLVEVNLDGRRVMPERSGTAHVLPGAMAGSSPGPHVVRIDYHIPSSSRFGPNVRTIASPCVAVPVLAFHVSLVLPDDVRLGDGSGLAFSVADAPWKARALFGPLSRSAGGARFNPFQAASWQRLAAGFSTDAGDDAPDADSASISGRSLHGWMSGPRGWPYGSREVGAASNGPLLLPAGWTRHLATAPSVPAEIRVVLWSDFQAQLLAWCGLLLCLVCGIGLRRRGAARGARFATWGASGLLLLALTLPPVYADIAGGALAGILIAALLPGQLVIRPRVVTPQAGEIVPPGSTQSFAAVAGMFLVVAVCFGVGAGADEDPPALRGPAVLAANGQRRFDVLIPIGPDGNPAGATPLAYVPRELLVWLQALQPRPSRVPDYLISSALYAGALADDQSAVVHAKFQVRVLSAKSTVGVVLPLSNVNLGGANACLANGQPHAILRSTDGKSLTIELPGAIQKGAPLPDSPLEKAVAPPPAAVPAKPPAPKTGKPAEPGRDDGDALGTLYEIDLQLHPLVSSDAEKAIVKMGIPPVCDARVTAAANQRWPVVEFGAPPGEAAPVVATPVNAASNAPTPTQPGPVSAWLGRATELHARWLAVPGAEAPAEIQAAVSCLIDISPAVIQTRYLVNYRVVSGKINYLDWNVSPGSVLRSLQAPDLLNQALESTPTGDRHLLMEFATPQTSDFAVSAVFVLPTGGTPESIRLPALNLFAPVHPALKTTVTLNQLAVRQPSDFSLRLTSEQPDQLKPRAVDDFLKVWNVGGLRPQAAYLLAAPVALTLTLEPLVPALRVSGTLSGHVAPGRVDWTYAAEVETQTAPAFQYHLRVDPRFQIASVSVQEDEAERLLRWSRSGEHVVVFLSDKTTHLQTLRLQGTTRWQAPQEIDVPHVHFAEGATAPVRLVLYHSRDLKLALPPNNPLPRLEPLPKERSPDYELLEGVFLLPADGEAGLRFHVNQTTPKAKADAVRVVAPRNKKRTSPPAQPSIEPKSAVARELSIALTETQLWLDDAGNTQGRSLLWLAPSERPHLDLFWPTSAEPQGLLIDGESWPLPAPQGDIRRIPLPRRGTSLAVLYAWSSPAVVHRAAFRRIQQEMPVPQAAIIDRALLSMIPARPGMLPPRSTFAPFDPWIVEFGRWDAALALRDLSLRAPPARSPSPAFDAAAVLTRLDAAAETLQADPAFAITARLASHLQELRQRTAEVGAARRQSRPAVDRSAESPSELVSTGLGVLSPTLPATAILGPAPGDGTIDVWLADRHWLELTFAGLIAVIMGLIGLKLVNWGLWSWLRTRDSLAWVCLGGLWWLCLAPSWLGLFLVLWGCGQAAFRRMSLSLASGAPTSSSHVPSL